MSDDPVVPDHPTESDLAKLAIVDRLRSAKKAIFKVDFWSDDWTCILDLAPMTTHDAITTIEEWCQEQHSKSKRATPYNVALALASEVTIRLMPLPEGGAS